MVVCGNRLNQPILAVRKETADLRFVLPSGALLNIVVEAPARGLVEAEWNAEVVRMFVEDVRSRGIRVESLISSDLLLLCQSLMRSCRRRCFSAKNVSRMSLGMRISAGLFRARSLFGGKDP